MCSAQEKTAAPVKKSVVQAVLQLPRPDTTAKRGGEPPPGPARYSRFE